MKIFGQQINKYFLLVIFLGAILRLVALDTYPVGFTPDEASYGYDAYSLINTGKDQWGETWPLTFRSFGDSKLPLYTYLAIPSVKAFGLSEFATRLPNALLGVLAIVATYLMVKELFKKEKYALVSAFLLAISPWHVALSRGAFEANLTSFFMPLGIWAFLRGLRDKKWMSLSALLFGINIFSYHSARLITPVIILILVCLYRKELGVNFTKSVRNYLTPIIIFGIFLTVAFYAVFAGGSSRAADVTIFNPTDKWMAVFDRRYEAVLGGLPHQVARVFSNKAVYLVDTFTSAYATYLSPQFLFTQGAGEWTYGMIPGRGVLYTLEAIFVLMSLWFLSKNGFKASRPLTFLFLWILVSPIPAALTKGPGFAGNRAAVMIPAIQAFSAFGVIALYDLLKKVNTVKKLFWSAFTVIFSIMLVIFLEDYIYHAPMGGAEGMLYGRKEAVEFVDTIEEDYSQIIFSRTLSEPQIYVAFYQKWDPTDYQEHTRDWLRYEEEGLSFIDQLGEYNLGKYTFRNINFNEDVKIPGVLLVGKPGEFLGEEDLLKVVEFPNQKPAIYIYDPQEVSLEK